MSKRFKDRFVLILETTIEIAGLLLLAISVIRNQQPKKGKRKK